MSTDELITCECTHLTDFSVLMSIMDNKKAGLTDTDVRNLHLISTTGCIISIVFLILAYRGCILVTRISVSDIFLCNAKLDVANLTSTMMP